MTSIVEELHQPFLVSQFFNPKRELYESKLYIVYGGSPGLLVMGGGSCSEGHEFESQHCILDGHDIFLLYSATCSSYSSYLEEEDTKLALATQGINFCVNKVSKKSFLHLIENLKINDALNGFEAQISLSNLVKHSTLDNFQYDSRVINYDCRAFTRSATSVESDSSAIEHSPLGYVSPYVFIETRLNSTKRKICYYLCVVGWLNPNL